MDRSLFKDELLNWYDQHKRSMPWRDAGDPYKTWVSEIMLQQTRVEQATPYFLNFISQFPTVDELAAAEQQDVLKAWEGLGYYSRARNLHYAAKQVSEEMNGNIPGTYKELLGLKGIGPYTAAAISSISFDETRAAVDGNVIRVICRLYGIEDDVRSTKTRNQVQELADQLIHKKRPGDHNQAMMELGSQICTPTSPDCEHCPVHTHCVAHKMARTDSIPYKSKAGKKPHKHIGVGIIHNEDGRVLIALRPEDVMLGGLWEFPGGKQEKEEEITETVIRELKEELGVEVKIIRPFMDLKHTYSHFSITLHSFICIIDEGTPKPRSSQEIKWVKINELEQYPFPKANKSLTEKLINNGI
ncbi:A/G-specific adenine glycosylase [Balneola sp. MJW-20]|uniref:A/G-specific adenine glycosylase n=1 Tax=Gracilimonas aurantiaca TaxID=3234185 RepID=UPI003467A8A7